MRRAFAGHLASYLAVMVLLVGIWALGGRGYFWPAWVMLGWGFALLWHAIRAYVPGVGDRDRRDRR